MSNTKFGAQLMSRFDQFARHSDVPGEITRLYLSPAHKRASEELSGWMRAAGMTVRCDALATLIGRYDGKTPDAPALLVGSHIDSVRDGGKYDGTLGVFAALAAVEELHKCGERLPFAVEVVAFGDEEGVRFPVTLCGSKALAGTMDPSILDMVDADGISLRNALIEFGCDPSGLNGAKCSPSSVLGFVEAHIEQGPVLEKAGQPLGIVTAINGAKRFQVTVTGSAGHAGTVPMALRHDSLAASAEMILAVEALALESGEIVATVGAIQTKPGAVNVISGATVFSIDLRSHSDTIRDDSVAKLNSIFNAIADRRNVSVAVEQTHSMSAVDCAPRLISALHQATEMTGFKPIALSSGAGHDAMAMAPICDAGMLFVRCKEGLSHHPDEAITEEDADACVRALLHFMRTFGAEADV